MRKNDPDKANTKSVCVFSSVFFLFDMSDADTPELAASHRGKHPPLLWDAFEAFVSFKGYP